jgi:hypothetical protein
MTLYRDGDTIAGYADYMRHGGTLDKLSELSQIADTEYLARLLGLPADKPAQHDTDQSFDLWASDALDLVL